ncbi:MAG: hypothetical protein HYU66_14740, partial [Armatimonadetes bacterium]|nr:hypothetical protein [Armatimonadota bacterium]
TGLDPTLPTSYTVSTFAGSGAAAITDGVGTSAAVNKPYALALDGSGNLFVSEANTPAVRRVTPDGVMTTVAGTGIAGTADGIGNVATLQAPYGLAWSNDGLVVSEYTANKLRLVSLREGASPATSLGWVVRTLAGAGTAGGTDGVGTAAQFKNPTGAAIDGAGNIFVSEGGNHKVREVVPTNGHLTLNEPDGSAPAEPVAVANPDGFAPSTGMGSNTPFIRYAESVDRGATSSTKDWYFSIPSGVKAFEFTVLVQADTAGPAPPPVGSSTLGSDGSYVRTLAGADTFGLVDGLGTQARFHAGHGLCFAPEGVMYVGDDINCAIRRVEADGTVVTIAGLTGAPGSSDGTGSVADFDGPAGVAVSADGQVVFVADENAHTVRRVALTPGADPTDPANWTVTTIAGLYATAGYADGDGVAARFSGPHGIVVDAVGTVYLTEATGYRVRKLQCVGGDASLATNWLVSLVAGSTAGTPAHTDGEGAAARFMDPMGLALDRLGRLVVVDAGDQNVRLITLPGTVTTIGTNADLGWDVAADQAGNLYFTVTKGLVRLSPSSVWAYVAGSSSTSGSVDGAGNAARLAAPRGRAISDSGNLATMDQNGNRLRVVERVVTVGAP